MMTSTHHHQRGLSIIELMVAITLSMILTLGVFQIFSSSKQTSRVQDGLARLQENARFALDVLAHDIRMAGQLGCNGNANTFYSASLANHGAPVFGYEQSANPAIQLLAGNNLATPANWQTVSSTDAIVIISATPNNIPITAVGAGQIQVAAAGLITDIDEGDPVLISDCENADLTIAGARAGNALTLATNYNYSPGAELARINYIAYRVLLDTNSGYRNLHRAFVNAQTGVVSVDQEPLLEGVENFQLFYGEENNDGTIKYVTAAGVTNWQNVSSVRVHLLLSTLEDSLATEAQRYWYVQDGVDNMELKPVAGDRRLYRSFTTTIQLRNQGIGI